VKFTFTFTVFLNMTPCSLANW